MTRRLLLDFADIFAETDRPQHAAEISERESNQILDGGYWEHHRTPETEFARAGLGRRSDRLLLCSRR